MSPFCHFEATMIIRRKLAILAGTAALVGAAFACAPEAKAPTQASTPPPAPVKKPAFIPVATAPAPTSTGYTFVGGFPTTETVQRAYDDADLARAMQAYRFFYPTVSMAALAKGTLKAGAEANKTFFVLACTPRQAVLTPNSDTPYAMGLLDLTDGPVVVELPPGALLGVVNDLNQRYVMDLGLPGPDAGKGGKHIVLPPHYGGKVPIGYYRAASTTNRAILMLRALPPKGDMQAAVDLLKSVKIHPQNPAPGWEGPTWLDVGDRAVELTPSRIERGLEYWQELASVIETEPAFEAYRMNYGDLAALGIVKGKPFAPDERMQRILTQAARLANDQMRVQSFADRRPERLAWKDRKWEWASLRSENGTFDLAAHKDLGAREKWFFQAAIESPAMFRRSPGTGSLYWLGVRDKTGAYLDGAKTYKLSVPLPVPNKLFWSVTIYDPDTRSQIATPQNRAALRSLVELKELGNAKSVDLYFGPKAPPGQETRFVQTLPDKGWFSYFRVYGPEKSAFDGSWKPGDFEEVK